MTMGIACGHYLAIMSSIEHALINGSKKFTGAFYDLLYTFPQRELFVIYLFLLSQGMPSM